MKPVNKPRTQFLKGVQWHHFFPPWNHRFEIRDLQYAWVYLTLFPFIFKGWVVLDLPFTLGLDVPSPQSLQVWRGFSFSLRLWAGQQRSSHTHSCHRDASCPLYFGALGRNFCSIGLTVLFGYLLILLCMAQNSDFQMPPLRQPGEQDWASLSFLTASSERLPAPSLPRTAKPSFWPLIFVYFSCNLVLIRFQIPQIRECESNAGSYWVQKSACIYRHFYSIQPLWSQPSTPPLTDSHLMITKDVSQRTAETAFWEFWIF